MADLAGRWNQKRNKKKRENARKKSKEEKEPESRATIDMTRIVPKVTNATRCCAIPLGENAKPFQKDMTGFPKTYKQ